MGDKALRKTAQSFGLDDAFTFRDLVVENSAYASSSAALLGADLAWTGAGQNQLAVTPLHMCMVAAAVANDGVMMEPRLLLRAVGAEGALDVPYGAVRWDGAFEAVIECGGHSADILRRQRGGHGVGAGRLRRQVVQTAVHGGGGEALRRFDDDEPAIP